MRVRTGSSATGGRDVFASTADSEVWLLDVDDPLLDRADPYARRVFRDAHPLDDLPGTVDNGNGQRILIGPQGLKALANDNPHNYTQPLSATDTSPGDLSGLPCDTGFCHLGGPTISDSDAYGAGLVNVSTP